MELKSFEAKVQLPDEQDKARLVEWLRTQLPDLSGGALRRLISTGKVSINGQPVLNPAAWIQPGQRLAFNPNAPRYDRHKRDPHPDIPFFDEDIAVGIKRSGILTIPLREERDSLGEELRRALPRLEGKKGSIPPLMGVHRLDKPASGLVVFARNVPAQRELQNQWKERTVERAYYALVNGEVRFDGRTLETTFVADRGDGLKGTARDPDQKGKPAITHFEVVERLHGATLLRCTLETGRTHQIRIHAAEMGHPIVGEEVYIRDHRGPKVKARRLMLHAVHISFDHPRTGERMSFDSTPPLVMTRLVDDLRKGPQVRWFPPNKSKAQGKGTKGPSGEKNSPPKKKGRAGPGKKPRSRR